jgi:PAS domain S-box-containing protein
MDKKLKKIEQIIQHRVDALGIIRLFLYHSPTSIVMLDKDAKLLLWSRKFAQEFFVKTNGSEFQGKPIEEVAPSVHNIIKDTDKFKLSPEGESYEGVIGINGEKRYFAYEIAPWISDGLVEGVIVTFVDITKQKKAEKRLFESDSRYRTLLETSGDWIWEVDKNATYTYSSALSEEVLGYTSNEIIGKTPFNFMETEEAQKISKIYFECAREKAPIDNLINWNITKTGEKVCLLTSAVPILDDDENLLGYRGTDRRIPCNRNPFCVYALKNGPVEELKDFLENFKEENTTNE